MTDLGPNKELVGIPGSRDALATPALILDLNAFDRNLDALTMFCGQAGLRMRPHAKSHKCSEIAKRQIAAGAIGVCCATLKEAEVMIGAGVPGVLVTSPIVGARRVNSIASLAKTGERVMLVTDNPVNHLELAETARREGMVLDLLVDLDVGMHRTGTASPQAAVALAQQIADHPHTRFRGIQAYSGRVQHIESYDERQNIYNRQMNILRDALAQLSRAGLKPDIVTGGGTGTHDIDRDLGLFTELQTGSYALMDVEYNLVTLRKDAPSPFETSLFMQCSIVSNNAAGMVTLNGGFKCFATDGPLPKIQDKTFPGAAYDWFGDEHGKMSLALGTNETPALGSPVTLVTPHCDPTVNLHDHLHCVRGNKLTAIWRIDARGVL